MIGKEKTPRVTPLRSRAIFGRSKQKFRRSAAPSSIARTNPSTTAHCCPAFGNKEMNSERTPELTISVHEQKHNIDDLLRSAAIVSWPDLMPTSPRSLIHIEYQLTSAGTLDYLQLWSSIKSGYWLLACTYWMSASPTHGPGLYFENGYQSEKLRRVFELVMQHQDAFALPRDKDRPGLLQVITPNDDERNAAAASIASATAGVTGSPVLQ